MGKPAAFPGMTGHLLWNPHDLSSATLGRRSLSLQRWQRAMANNLCQLILAIKLRWQYGQGWQACCVSILAIQGQPPGGSAAKRVERKIVCSSPVTLASSFAPLIRQAALASSGPSVPITTYGDTGSFAISTTGSTCRSRSSTHALSYCDTYWGKLLGGRHSNFASSATRSSASYPSIATTGRKSLTGIL